jgi:hypothetical protein
MKRKNPNNLNIGLKRIESQNDLEKGGKNIVKYKENVILPTEINHNTTIKDFVNDLLSETLSVDTLQYIIKNLERYKTIFVLIKIIPILVLLILVYTNIHVASSCQAITDYSQYYTIYSMVLLFVEVAPYLMVNNKGTKVYSILVVIMNVILSIPFLVYGIFLFFEKSDIHQCQTEKNLKSIFILILNFVSIVVSPFSLFYYGLLISNQKKSDE